MGSKKYAKLGPYVLCTNSPATRMVDVSTCSNSACNKHGMTLYTKFCDLCGAQIRLMALSRPSVKVSRDQVYDKIGDNLSLYGRDDGVAVHNTDVYRGNTNWYGSLSSHSEDDPGVYEVTPEQIAAELEKFQAFYAVELRDLRDLYGQGNVTVKWGLVVYWC